MRLWLLGVVLAALLPRRSGVAALWLPRTAPRAWSGPAPQAHWRRHPGAAWAKAKSDEEGQEAQTQKKAGHPHTEASRAKIGAANKGKTPWNKGRRHDPATIEKIRLKTIEAYEKRKAAKLAEEAAAEGLSVAQLEQRREDEARTKTAAKAAKVAANQGKRRSHSEETKRLMSARMKERWADPVYREQGLKQLEKLRANTTRKSEINAKISASLKKRWAEDPEYRAARVNVTVSAEARRKSAETLKRRWAEDEEFRARMMASFSKRNVSVGDKISTAIRAKWADPDYREKTLSAMNKYYESGDRNVTRTSTRQKSSRSRARKVQPGQGQSQVTDLSSILSSLSPAERVQMMQTLSRSGEITIGNTGALDGAAGAGEDAGGVPLKTAAQIQAEKDTQERQREARLHTQRLRRQELKQKKQEAAESSGDATPKVRKKPGRKKKGTEPVPDPTVSIGAEGDDAEATRMERIRMSNPELWGALYAQDEDVENLYDEGTMSSFMSSTARRGRPPKSKSMLNLSEKKGKARKKGKAKAGAADGDAAKAGADPEAGKDEGGTGKDALSLFDDAELQEAAMAAIEGPEEGAANGDHRA